MLHAPPGLALVVYITRVQEAPLAGQAVPERQVGRQVALGSKVQNIPGNVSSCDLQLRRTIDQNIPEPRIRTNILAHCLCNVVHHPRRTTGPRHA